MDWKSTLKPVANVERSVNPFDIMQVILSELDRQFPGTGIDQPSMDALMLFANLFVEFNRNKDDGLC